MEQQLSQNSTLAENDRLSNFQNNFRTDPVWIKGQIQAQVSIINKYWPGHIDFNSEAPLNHTLIHSLHRNFENYCRRIEFGDLKNTGAPDELNRAFIDLNIALHRFEALPKEPTSDPFAPFNQDVVITFKDMIRRPLADSDFANFTLEQTFGGVYLNYCHSGRHLWEAFVSNDSMALETNLRPQSHYTAGVRIWFGCTVPPEALRQRYQDFYAWMKMNRKWIEKNKIDYNSRQAQRPGFAHLARISTRFLEQHPEKSIIENIGRLGFVKEVSIL